MFVNVRPAYAERTFRTFIRQRVPAAWLGRITKGSELPCRYDPPDRRAVVLDRSAADSGPRSVHVGQ